VQAWDRLPEADSLKARTADAIQALRTWDYRWSVSSIPTSIAVFWAEGIGRRDSAAIRESRLSLDSYIAARVGPRAQLEFLTAAIVKLTADFGSWRTPWGEINRFQRNTGDIVQRYNDAGPGIPVGFTSARWGSLASFAARAYRNTKKWYGSSGNSFVAVVEFGDSVRAVAVTAGGLSGDPQSPHFNDQAKRYSTGDLREVYFYPSKLAGHIEREYRPGE
jgi:acyl-homoserine-lactone acylase